jgi:hypothetical protein
MKTMEPMRVQMKKARERSRRRRTASFQVGMLVSWSSWLASDGKFCEEKTRKRSIVGRGSGEDTDHQRTISVH